MVDDRNSGFEPMSEAAESAALARSFSGLHMDRGVEGIERRARSISRRRRAVPALAVVALGAAIGVTSTVGPHAPAPVAGAATVTDAGSLSLSGWSVRDDTQTGEITVTVKDLNDQAGLLATLAKDGVRAQIRELDQPGRSSNPSPWAPGDEQYFGVPFIAQPDGTFELKISKSMYADGSVLQLTLIKIVPWGSPLNVPSPSGS